MFEEKISRLREELGHLGAEGAVLTHPENVYYATGFESVMDGWRLPEPISGVYIPSSESEPIVLLLPEASLISLLVAEREGCPVHFQALKTFDLLNFCVMARSEDLYLKLEEKVGERLAHFSGLVEGECEPDIVSALSAMLKKRSTQQKLILFDDLRIGFKLNQSLEQHYEDAFDMLFRVRAIKTKQEIEVFRESGVKADRVMEYTVAELGEGKIWAQIEKSVARFMIDEDINPLPSSPMLFGGTYDMAFKPDLFRTLFKERLESGQVVILETQGQYKKVWIDINRTAHIGCANEAYREQHKMVKSCFDAVAENLKPGQNTAEICEKVRSTLAKDLDSPGKLLLIIHSIGAFPLENPLTFPSTGLGATKGFDIKSSMILSFDCLYFGSKLGPSHMENVFEITQSGSQSLYRYPLELIEV